MVHFVHGQALFDVRREVAGGAAEGAVSVVVLVVPVQVPLVRRAKVAEVAFDHGHGVVLDVFGEPGFDVGDVAAFGAAEKFGFDVLLFFVPGQLTLVARRERAERAFEIGRFWFGFRVGVGCLGRFGRSFLLFVRLGGPGGVVEVEAPVDHLDVPQELLEVLRGVEAIGALVYLDLFLVNVAQVVEEMSGVLREIGAVGAGVVAPYLALRQLVGVGGGPGFGTRP